MTHTHAKIRPKVNRFKCYSEERRTDTTDFIIFLAKIPACIANCIVHIARPRVRKLQCEQVD